VVTLSQAEYEFLMSRVAQREMPSFATFVELDRSADSRGLTAAHA
jgi:hypothetical protein